jgi:hypothetical protein
VATLQNFNVSRYPIDELSISPHTVVVTVANEPEQEPMETNTPDLLSLREAAECLGANRTWLAGAIAAAEIQLTPIGQSKAVKRSDIERLRPLVPPKRKAASSS